MKPLVESLIGDYVMRSQDGAYTLNTVATNLASLTMSSSPAIAI